MPSKRSFMIGGCLVPEQEISERLDDLVRLAAAKDAEIAGLRGIASARLATIEALRADHATEVAALTEQRDRAMGALREPSESEIDAAWMAYRKFKCQEDNNREHIRAALVAAYAVALAALDPEAAAETAPSLLETP